MADTRAAQEEMVDILEPTGKPAGWSTPKSEAHRRGLYHHCFHCWIAAPAAPGGPYLFVQRRARQKENWPGRLDTTAAGHLSAGESVMDGLREVEEELGLTPGPERLVPLGTRRVEQEIPAGVDREFHSVFLLLEDLDPGALRFQREEVEALLRLRLQDVERLYSGEEITAVEWDADGATRETPVRIEGFVPNEDRYPLIVSRAVAAYMRGEEVGRTFRFRS